ncbi:hypothetical protein Tcan_03318 [Toxocara canis]|uniref:Uncharacterized protein n=1 Tax=Toxocara canis TaxID=6265 RepID=A0A0B2VZ08_TOXCA|nr:hypothetical protein Tcan_03318 [Toxocara canis]
MSLARQLEKSELKTVELSAIKCHLEAQRIRSAIKYHLETQSICFAIECRSQQQKKKWRECYMMCCQPKDIRNVFLIVYKNCKNRLRNKELFVITCDTFVGFESEMQRLVVM